ncbi:MAG: PHB depolymerase family esterase [Alphaproteobacteria bacterium]|nr:PHB depolymerase family esterase [Alphaproteobacteria bacterium]
MNVLCRTLASILVWAGLSVSAAAAAPPLPALGVDLSQSSVSGLSSGAYMAGQLHVAHSETFIGAGIVAGGPFACAESWYARRFPGWAGMTFANAQQALYRCMQTYLGTPQAEPLLERTEELASAGKVDPTSGLRSDRVYVFSGEADNTVKETVVATAVEYYRLAGLPEAQISYTNDSAAGHAFVIEEGETYVCGTSQSPYLNDCDFDQAGAVLAHIYGTLAPRVAEPAGRFQEFDQAEFLNNPEAKGMDPAGVVYVPPACETDAGCRVHIALHGCHQNRDSIDEVFVRETGYANWADNNRLVILFPQTIASPGNPNACWDWWGYSGTDFLTKEAPQIAAIRQMLDRLAEPHGE